MEKSKLKDDFQGVEEGKRIFFEGVWYKKLNGELIEETAPKGALIIEKCSLCNKEIMKQEDRKAFKDWGVCLSCYYHKKRKEETNEKPI